MPKGERSPENPALTQMAQESGTGLEGLNAKRQPIDGGLPFEGVMFDGSIKDSPLTLCEFCRQPFTPSRRGSPQRFCKPSHRVAAFQKAKRLNTSRLVSAGRSRGRTRRTVYPHGCWREAWECLSRHPGCICRRCLYNTCHCWAGLNDFPIAREDWNASSAIGMEGDVNAISPYTRVEDPPANGTWHGSAVLSI